MEQKIIQAICKAEKRIIIALDGRSASGKTTMAENIEKNTGCAVVHMDDFFMPREQRREEIGGNIDFERLIKDVLEPFKKGEKVVYEPFLCKTQELGEKCVIEGKDVLLLEGTYSTHERITDFCDYSFFTDITKEEQLERIKKRNPHNYNDFINMWLVREEEYFNAKRTV